MKTVRVDVTKDDIKKPWGDPLTDCSVARGISRAIGSQVTVGFTFWKFAGQRKLRALPRRATDNICAISAHKRARRIKPFSFEIEVPE